MLPRVCVLFCTNLTRTDEIDLENELGRATQNFILFGAEKLDESVLNRTMQSR